METQKIKMHIENYISEVEHAIHDPIWIEMLGQDAN